LQELQNGKGLFCSVYSALSTHKLIFIKDIIIINFPDNYGEIIRRYDASGRNTISCFESFLFLLWEHIQSIYSNNKKERSWWNCFGTYRIYRICIDIKNVFFLYQYNIQFIKLKLIYVNMLTNLFHQNIISLYGLFYQISSQLN